MTMHSEDWGFWTRLFYKVFRPKLVAVAEKTKNEVDDTVIKVADEVIK